MKESEFQTFVELMNEAAQQNGLKVRELDREYLQRQWKGFVGYNRETNTVDYKELLYVLWQSGM